MSTVNPSRIFIASCVALTVTAMTFALRASILGDLASGFELTATQLGWINSMAFLGFPVATMVGGLIYNLIGPKKLMYLAFFCHFFGLIFTITANGFITLLLSSFLVGFANGAVEAACNPLIADMYHKNKTTMLNRFHVWFPGGIVIGALAGTYLGSLGVAWQVQIAIMLVPTLIYGFLIFGQTFPEMSHSEMSTSTNLKAMLSPIYIFMLVCMTLTAVTELGTGQWINQILSSTGAHPLLILALTAGIMAVGRYFAGAIVHRINPVGVLLFSAIVSTIGLYLFTVTSGAATYLAAVVFALGVTYFWPTMIGFIGEYQPKTGALGMSIIGGVGMFSVSIWNPVIGSWIDNAKEKAMAGGVSDVEADLLAGQAALANLGLFPAVLIILFGALFIMRNKVTSEATEQVAEIEKANS